MFQSTITNVIFYCYLASDGKTPATGLSDVAVQISKNCGAYGNPSAGAVNATEISNGAYYVTLSATDTNTLGPLGILATESTIDDVRFDRFVVAGDPYAWLVTNVGALGANLSALVTAIATDISNAAGSVTLAASQTATINANVVQWNGASPANLDGSGFPNVHVQAISANVTVGDYATNEDPATLLASSFSPLATESSLATAQGTLNTINTNTSSIPSATTIAAAVWGALTSGLTVANSIGARILAFFGSGNYTAQTGDSFARLGAPAGASVSADIAAVASSAASAASSSASAASSAATAASSAGSAATAAGSAATSAATAATNTGTIITTLDSLENPPIVSDTVQASPAPSPTSCAGSAALNQATNAYGSPSGRQMSILFTSGANQGLAGRVVGSYFSSSVVVLTFEAFPVAPEAGDTFDILGA